MLITMGPVVVEFEKMRVYLLRGVFTSIELVSTWHGQFQGFLEGSRRTT